MKEAEIKAKELVEKFYGITDLNFGTTEQIRCAIQCAIICQEREVFNLTKMYRDNWIDENHLKDFRLKLEFEQQVLTHLKEM